MADLSTWEPDPEERMGTCKKCGAVMRRREGMVKIPEVFATEGSAMRRYDDWGTFHPDCAPSSRSLWPKEQ